MEKHNSRHLFIKYYAKFDNTEIDTMKEHIKIDKSKGEVIWGQFAKQGRSNNFEEAKIKILDKQINASIPTFIFFYCYETKKLYVGDYINRYKRNDINSESSELELIPKYYRERVGMIPDGQTDCCRAFLRVSNIREIDFDNTNKIFQFSEPYPSMSERIENNNRFSLAYVNIEKKLYEVQANMFDGFNEENDYLDIKEINTNKRRKKVISMDDLDNIFEDSPNKNDELNRNIPSFKGRNIQYEKKAKRDKELGLLGEEFVIKVERMRLKKAKKYKLADAIEHTSKKVGDGTGFDIKSFEEDGTVRYIEVKTTTKEKKYHFYVSRTEMEFSNKNKDSYYLYRVYNFDIIQGVGKIFVEKGKLEDNFNCSPETYFVKR